RARALQALEAALVVDRVARADGIRGHVHFDAAVEQVVHGLADAHVRLDPANDRLLAPSEVEALRAHGRENGLLERLLTVETDLRRGTAEALGVLLGYERGHLEQACAREQRRARSRDALERRVWPKRLLHVDD